MADKYIRNNAGTLTEVEAKVTSAGAGDAGKIVALDGAGRIDNSVLPVGVGRDTQQLTAGEGLSAGNYVNINPTGFTVRRADATTAGKHAHGFVLDTVLSGVTVTVYFEGTNTAVTGQTAGDVFLSTTPGIGAATPPSGSGNIVQRIGVATSATTVNFEARQQIVLA